MAPCYIQRTLCVINHVEIIKIIFQRNVRSNGVSERDVWMCFACHGPHTHHQPTNRPQMKWCMLKSVACLFGCVCVCLYSCFSWEYNFPYIHVCWTHIRDQTDEHDCWWGSTVFGWIRMITDLYNFYWGEIEVCMLERNIGKVIYFRVNVHFQSMILWRFSFYGNLGKISKYRIDWLERWSIEINLKKGPFVTAGNTYVGPYKVHIFLISVNYGESNLTLRLAILFSIRLEWSNAKWEMKHDRFVIV